MMHEFVGSNRDELIHRCREKVAKRPHRIATEVQLSNGIPMFLTQLHRTLQSEEEDEGRESIAISGSSGGDSASLSELGVSAAAHGKQLLALGYTVSQVVHDYGDLCQAITDLAFERGMTFSVDEYRTLNRCLDNAIADAVTEFSLNRDELIIHRNTVATNVRIGFLVHEIRNALGTASLAFDALKTGALSLSGSTAAVLERSLKAVNGIVSRSIEEVRSNVASPSQSEVMAVHQLVLEVKTSAELNLASKRCTLTLEKIDDSLKIQANRAAMTAALTNLVQNGIKFTNENSDVMLSAHASNGFVNIDVTDHCGGLPEGSVEKLFIPFSQIGDDKTGLGLGLYIARQQVEAEGGTLGVRDVKGVGCVFTLRLPLHIEQ